MDSLGSGARHRCPLFRTDCHSNSSRKVSINEARGMTADPYLSIIDIYCNQVISGAWDDGCFSQVAFRCHDIVGISIARSKLVWHRRVNPWVAGWTFLAWLCQLLATERIFGVQEIQHPRVKPSASDKQTWFKEKRSIMVSNLEDIPKNRPLWWHQSNSGPYFPARLITLAIIGLQRWASLHFFSS